MFVGDVLSPHSVCKEHLSLQTGSMLTVGIGVLEPVFIGCSHLTLLCCLCFM